MKFLVPFVLFFYFTAVALADPCPQALARRPGRWKSVVGNGMVYVIVAGTGPILAVTATSDIPLKYRVITGFLVTVGMVATNAVGAVIFDRLRARIKQVSFANATQYPRAQDNDDLEGHYSKVQASFSENAQFVQGTINNYVTPLKTDLGWAYLALRQGDEEHAVHLIASQAKRLKRRYPSTFLDHLDGANRLIGFKFDADIVDAVRETFAYAVSDPAAFVKRVLKRLEETDPAFHQPEPNLFYKTFLTTCFL